jgi:hypothetical protein
MSKQADLYVSTDGDDRWTGALPEANAAGNDGPLATLDAARLRMREIKSAAHRDYLVLIRGGTYGLSSAVLFDIKDTAPDERIVTYAAYPGERPVFSAGVPVTGWEKSDSPAIADGARGQVWCADLPHGLGCIKSLFDGAQLLPRARSGMFFYQGEMIHSWDAVFTDESKWVAKYPAGALKSWHNVEDIEVGARSVNWTINYLPMAKVDLSSNTAVTAIPATYSFNRGRKSHGSSEELPTLWIENALEYLTEPGQWTVDTVDRKIYYWPENDLPGDDVIAPALRELVRVEGCVDLAGPVDQPLKGLIFRGLTFKHGDRDVWTLKDAGIQHDWEMIDKADALLRFRGVEQCAAEDCTFTESGGTALRFDLHAMHCRALGNHIHHIGQGGVMLIGYGPGTKDVNRLNGVVNNHIHDCGLIYPHSHGIVMSQSGGNRIANNYIHHMPRKAICLTGVRMQRFSKRERDTRECARSIRWHEVGTPQVWEDTLPFLHTRDNLVEYNEIELCLQQLGDGSTLNVSGAGRGNLIRRNYIHDIYGAEGEWVCACVRTDDWQRGTLITENVIARSNTSAFEHKCENQFVNNIIIDVNPENIIRFGRHWGPFERSVLSRNVFVNSTGSGTFYFPKKDLREMTTCDIEDNVYFNVDGSPTGTDLAELARQGHNLHSIEGDPMLTDPENGDFRLKEGSPARTLGICSFDVRSAGLLC